MTGRMMLVLGAFGLAAASPSLAEDGSARAVVTSGSSAMPSWTPDGTHLVFHSRRKDAKQHGIASRNIWMVAADGTDERQLTKGTKDEYHPALSPDGKKLLFVSELNGSRDIWIADPDGQNAVPLTDDPGTEDQPAWSPDGRQIVYAAFPKEGGSFDLWLMYADGGGPRPPRRFIPPGRPTGAPSPSSTGARRAGRSGRSPCRPTSRRRDGCASRSRCAAEPTSTPRSCGAATRCAARSLTSVSACAPPTAPSSSGAMRWRPSSSTPGSAASPASSSPTATRSPASSRTRRST